MPILIEPNSRFILWGESAPIAPKGRMNEKRRAAIARENARYGARTSQSTQIVTKALAITKPLVQDAAHLWFETDEKPSYPSILRQVFRGHVIHHATTSSLEERDFKNPLFPINQTEAVARDLMGRLRRNSWLVSKERKYLNLAFHVFSSWRNYVRPRFNRDKRTPAELLGFVPRRLSVRELYGWRQDWGPLSPRVAPGVGRS